MIGKVITGSFVYGLLNYLEREMSEILDKNMLGETVNELTKEFILMSESNTRVKRNVKHLMLSFAENDNLSREDMIKLLNEYLQKIGYNNNQFVAYLHNDTDHKHIHILVNKINYEGENTHIKFEKRKSREVIMELEKKYNLTQTSLISKDKIKQFDLKYQELKNRLNAKGELTDKQYLELKIKELLKTKPTYDKFVEELSKLGIKAELNSAKNGITFEYNNIKYKGSSLDRKELTFNKIMERLSNEFEKDTLIVKKAKSEILTLDDKEKQEKEEHTHTPNVKSHDLDGAEEERRKRLNKKKRNR